MIYLYNKYHVHKYWAPPFNNLLDGLKIYFNNKGLLCEYIDGNIPSKNDLIIAISGTITSISDVVINNCKLIIINSECVNLSNKYIGKSKMYMNKYINYSNLIQIWDYSLKNINFVKKITSVPCYYVPITYLPSFENIYNNNTKKKYDILLFGCSTASKRRMLIKDKLDKKGLNVLFGSWNDSNILKDNVSKAKIVIIIHFYDDDLCIDYYRLHSLISSKIFTISEMPSNDQIDPNMNKLIFSKYDNFVDTCVHYLSKTQKERDIIANDIYQWWKQNNHMDKYIPTFEVN